MRATSVNHPSGSRGNGVAVLDDSSIVAVGRRNPAGLVEKYTAAGVPAPGFIPDARSEEADFNGVAVLPGGLLLAGGTDLAASPDQQLAVRLLANGAPDPTFNGGLQTYAPGCRGHAMVLASNGDAILVGDDQTAPRMCNTRFAASATGSLIEARSVSTGVAGAWTARPISNAEPRTDSSI